ncbi:hypothetical protein [Spectribacter hydrogenoxidans]|uniref:Uncharacterized protein n=1 Tax=Spectribacter hydrogenoxidans TaxID=3075608 RepID=A0ABU3C0X1_9GAMM|nr:hypothetical protein [Salinisphaera sp. W335]MDT0635199.1 hypothetical protein [Salinisphaera sp. W335]
MTLVQFTFFIFVAIAIVGAAMAILAALRVRRPAIMGRSHGLAAFLALALLLLANLTTDASTLAWTAFGVLAAGFIGGGLLFRFIFKDRLPMKFVGMHASVGLLGLLLLYLTAF